MRKEVGTLLLPDLKLMREELERITGKDIDSTKTIVINFFFKEDTQNKKLSIEHYTSDKKYLKFFRRNPQYLQFFITEKGYLYEKTLTHYDSNEILRDLFFKYAFATNYIIIKPSGKFYRQVSEHRQDEIPDKVKADW